MNKINNKSLENFKNLPVLRLTGNFIGISAENKVKVNIEFINQTGEKIFEEKIARLNWQGNSSLVFPKKNYSLSLFEKDGVTKYNIKLFQDVPENNKYHLKANYIDPTHARNMNILTYVAKIWYPTFYDMDSSLGLFWNGSIFPTNKKFPDEYQTGDSLLWELVSKAYKEEIKDRYKELRKEKLSGENIKKYLEEFINEIPEEEYIEEQKNFKYTGSIKFIIKNNPIINQILHTIYPKRWYKINPER